MNKINKYGNVSVGVLDRLYKVHEHRDKISHNYYEIESMYDDIRHLLVMDLITLK